MFNPFKRNEVSDQQSFGDIVKGYVDLGTSFYKTNWWQLGFSKPDTDLALKSAAVYACVSTLAQEIARLRITHYKNPKLKGQEEQYSSHVSRLLNKPNMYQTRSDFFLMIMYALLMNGNAYAIATRDGRGRVIDLTPVNPKAVQPYVVPDTGEIFYQTNVLSSEPGMINPEHFLPQRNVLHIRLLTPTHPLVGVSPLISCNTSVTHGLSIIENSTKFFDNGSKPAGILSTPKPLNKDAAKRLRDAWSSGTTGINAGKVPVLDNDLTFQPMSLSAADSKVIEQYSMTKKDIAIAFKVPLYMVGEGESQFKTAEASQRDFVTRSLGFYIEHIEASLNAFFGFNGRTELVNFDVERGIMRPEYTVRIEGLAKGVQGGIFTPNEARATEGLKKVKGGDKVVMQKQNVPIELLGTDVLTELAEANNTDDSTTTDDEDEDEDKSFIANDYSDAWLAACNQFELEGVECQ
jgi:HK97 family phage portal protein